MYSMCVMAMILEMRASAAHTHRALELPSPIPCRSLLRPRDMGTVCSLEYQPHAQDVRSNVPAWGIARGLGQGEAA
ncbi:uncharacterized protein J3D65DRAFT_614004 [Phyllosticta citribraziliensis]|uniref:Secreted protein n=1 Tax=Phyllosticta citribraziliensis TaxID=989973 RepID=A0ABR1M4I9_9PEZI